MTNDPNVPERSAGPAFQPADDAAVGPQEAPTPPSPPGTNRPESGLLPPGVEYHRVYVGEGRRIGRGIAALVLLLAGMLLFGIIIGFAGGWIDSVLENDSAFAGGSGYTPVVHASLLLGIAVLLPWAMLVQKWLYRVPVASLHSVLGCFRWAIFGRAIVVVLPLWTIAIAVTTALEPTESIPWDVGDLIGLFVVTILFTPIQAAAEEYGFRGVAFRVAGSWGRTAASGLVIGAVISSVLFMASHLAFDPWLNLYYFVFGFTLCLTTWRTGGLEVAVVIHAVNNTIAFLLGLVLWSDFLAGWDRTVGAGSASLLLLCALLIGAAAVTWWTTRVSGPVRTPAVADA